MSDDHSRGLYQKYRVSRTDGSSAFGGKHDGCDYFVLDLTHDKHALPALRAYIASCQSEYPALAADLRAEVYAMEASIRDAAAPSLGRDLSETKGG